MVSDNELICFQRSHNQTSKLGIELKSLRSDEVFTDFTIISEDERLPCHKVLLAANSSMLKAMIKSNMVEAKTNQLHLNSISPPVIRVLLDYMYTGEIAVSEDIFMDLIEAANYLQLLELKQFCLNKVASLLKPENVIAWFKFAGMMDFKDILSQCSDMMCRRFHEVYQSKEFQALTYNEFSSYLGDIKDKSIDPDDVLSATLRWLSYDASTRSEMLEELIRPIPLQKCSVQCLKEEKEKHAALLHKNKDVSMLLFDAVALIASKPNARKKRGGFTNRDLLPVLLGGGNLSTNNQCWYLDSTEAFIDFCEIPDEFCHLKSSICKTPDGFILSGGVGSDICARFITQTKAWKRLANLPAKRHGHASLFIDGTLIIIGGTVNGYVSTTVQFFDVETETWRDGPPLPVVMDCPVQALGCPVVCAFDDDIFLFCCVSLYKLDSSRTSWQLKADPPKGFYFGPQMLRVEDEVVLLGGDGKVHVRYNPTTDTWRRCGTPKLPHSFGAVLHVGSKILLLGGHYQIHVEEYDTESDSWSLFHRKIPKPIGGLTGLLLNL